MEKPPYLEINVISAEALKVHNRPIKKNAFVIVRTDSNNSRSTSEDGEGGSYPSWNEKLQLPLPLQARSLAVEVNCRTGSQRFVTIGAANVPLSDIFADYTPANQLHFLSYRLRERDGGRNGIVNLSVRMVGPVQVAPEQSIRVAIPTVMPTWKPGKPVTAFPVSGVRKSSEEVAVGNPVPYGVCRF